MKLDTEEEKPIFQRMYICLDACKKGFKAGCRKVVGLDGCFFKGATNGELLCAVGRDGNNQMYPIAWAVVEKENNDSWDWFCDVLFRDLDVHGGDGWVFISDQQKGILNAVHNFQMLSIETVLGMFMSIGERSTRRKSGRRDGGGVLKHHATCCLIWQGQDLPSLVGRVHKQSLTAILSIGVGHGSKLVQIVTLSTITYVSHLTNG